MSCSPPTGITRCSPTARFPLARAESDHRGHAVVEQVFADLIDGPWAHLPSAAFNANAAWIQLAVTAHALTRALGTLASPRHAKARGATIRAELIRCRRPPRPHRTRPDHLAPARNLALATRLARRLQPPPTAPHQLLLPDPHPPSARARPETTVDTPDERPASPTRPRTEIPK